MLLNSLSLFTIVGWAWVSVAALRWVCRNIEAGQNQLQFLGSGWGLLWRYFLAVLASILIIPIPWVWLWVVRWVPENMLITQAATEYGSIVQDAGPESNPLPVGPTEASPVLDIPVFKVNNIKQSHLILFSIVLSLAAIIVLFIVVSME